MVNNREIKRLLEVYQGYQEDSEVEARWSDSNAGNVAIIKERNSIMLRILQEHGFLPLTRLRILDVGCGSGQMLKYFHDCGAIPSNLFGVDLLHNRIIEAKRRLPEIFFQKANAEYLGFKNDSFDLILLFTVFSSIFDDKMTHNIAHEVYRILKPGGAIVWYDMRYNNPNNRNVRGINAARIRSLFPGLQVKLIKVTLLPPLARCICRFVPGCYSFLSNIIWLRTHYLGLLKKI